MHDPLEALLQQRLDVRKIAGDALLRELEHHLLGPVDEIRRLPGPVLAEPLNLLADPDEAAQRGHLLDDLGVVLGVRAGRDERRQLCDLRGASDPLELAPLVELVRHRDRVDRLALAVQRERRPVDRAVRIAVEIGGVEHLRDGSDRVRREQHRPEHGFLRLEILRRHDRIQTWRGELGHCSIKPLLAGMKCLCKDGGTAAGGERTAMPENGGGMRVDEHAFAQYSTATGRPSPARPQAPRPRVGTKRVQRAATVTAFHRCVQSVGNP